MASTVVILAYLATLLLVVWPPRRFAVPDSESATAVPWWKNVRVWASVIIGVQIAVYAYWG